MVVTTIDGAYVAYDGTSDVAIISDVNGVDVAWKEAPVANDLLLLQNTNLRGNLQDLRGGLR
jgi:hypothetical protein